MESLLSLWTDEMTFWLVFTLRCLMVGAFAWFCWWMTEDA
jgi:hypothetical protein